eukprot:gene19560-biopygen2509
MSCDPREGAIQWAVGIGHFPASLCPSLGHFDGHPREKRQRTRTGRAPDARRTTVFEETDARRTRAGRARSRFSLGSQDTGAGVARAWRGRGAGYRPFLAWVARAWRGHGAGVARAWPVTPGWRTTLFFMALPSCAQEHLQRRARQAAGARRLLAGRALAHEFRVGKGAGACQGEYGSAKDEDFRVRIREG